jgi:hypothetical protein
LQLPFQSFRLFFAIASLQLQFRYLASPEMIQEWTGLVGVIIPFVLCVCRQVHRHRHRKSNIHRTICT